MLCFAVAVRFNGGKGDTHITSYTGLTLVDLDGIAPEALLEVLARVRADVHTLLAYTTLSGRGVRVVVRYEAPLSSPQKGESPESTMTALPPPSGGGQEGAASYKLAFNTVNEYYRRLTGIVPDKKCSNPTRLSALAYDPEVLFRPEAEAMDIDALAAQYAAEHKAGKRPVGRPRKAAKVAKVVRAADVADIQRFLTDNNVCIRYNVVTRKREILIDDDADENVNENWKELESKHVNSLYCRLCLTTGLTSNPNELYNVIESDFYPEYHPLRDYLDGLPEWDGHDYIDELALHHRQFEELTIEEELIYTYLRVPGENETGEFLTTTRIIELIGYSIRTPLDKRKVGRAMHGWDSPARRP